MSEPYILPRVPSQLIRIALEDLAKVEADPRYTVDMTRWHLPRQGVCHVCFAGAVLACRLDVLPDEYASPEYADNNRQQLNALDHFRCGCVDAGLAELDIEATPAIENCGITDYEAAPARFRAEMAALADRFEAEGL